MKLISMTDFVLEQDDDDLTEQKIESIFNYANFLKQPLKLEMFVPCDENSKVMVEPNENMEHLGYKEQYQQAKEKVLFEGFQYHKQGYVTNGIFKFDEEYLENKTIEDLVQFDLTLTESEIKKLGL